RPASSKSSGKSARTAIGRRAPASASPSSTASSSCSAARSTSNPSRATAPPAVEAGVEPAHVLPRVLVVEADRDAFNALAEALEEEGMLPVRARHGEEALRMAREVHPAVV